MSSRQAANQRQNLRSQDLDCPCFWILEKYERRLDDFKYSDRAKDMDLIINDNSVTRVHAWPFVQISPVLCQLLEANVVNEQKWQLVVDMDPEDLPAILDLVYTGVCEVRKDRVESLLRLAKVYNIQDLENLCGKCLEANLDLDNAVNSFKMAKNYLCKHLSKKFLSYVIRNISDLIANNTAKVI